MRYFSIFPIAEFQPTFITKYHPDPLCILEPEIKTGDGTSSCDNSSLTRNNFSFFLLQKLRVFFIINFVSPVKGDSSTYTEFAYIINPSPMTSIPPSILTISPTTTS